jgi:GDPmannose 4,6-dehydratase
LLGNPNKAKELLGWNPQETTFENLVKMMVKSDLKFVENDLLTK